MRKLSLDALAVESFATVDMPRQVRGTVEGRQDTYGRHATCNDEITCYYTCYQLTCDPSCRDTDCVTACQGGGDLSKAHPTCVQTE